MNKLIINCISCFFIFFSCNSPQQKKVEKKITETRNGFTLNGHIKSYLSDKVYLNKILEHSIYPIDSAIIENNLFVFNGIVNYPERFQLTFENYSASITLIIENTAFEIEVDPILIPEPKIIGSPLNTLLFEYKQNAKKIFNKMDLLYPKFQKARLENDSEKLAEIGTELQIIETKFRDYSYHFIKENSNSYVAVMVLRDQLKSSNIDSIRIRESYNLLSEDIKKSPDAEIVRLSLN